VNVITTVPLSKESSIRSNNIVCIVAPCRRKKGQRQNICPTIVERP